MKKISNNKKNIFDKATTSKQQNQKLANHMIPLIDDGLVSVKTQERIDTCAEYLTYLAGTKVNLETGEETNGKTVLDGYFCGNRFCPICSKTKARKDAIRLSAVMQALQTMDNQAFVFLTLTVPNCSGEDLEQTLLKMNDAFRKLTKRKMFLNAVNGYVKKVEVTYNNDPSSKSYDTYHPHFHVLLSVNEDYFSNRLTYISHNKWLNTWRSCMKDNSINQVNVKRANTDTIFEMSKYLAKDSQYLTSQEVFETFYRALKGKRLLTYSGNFAIYNKKYEDGELDNYKLKDLLFVDRLLRGLWSSSSDSYDVDVKGVFEFSTDDIEFKIIEEKCKARGYKLIAKSPCTWTLEYDSETTYGKDLTD